MAMNLEPKQHPVAMATLECKPRPQFTRFGCDLGLGRLIENWRDLGLEDSGQLEARKWNEWGAGRLAVILGRFPADGRSGKVVVGQARVWRKNAMAVCVQGKKKMNRNGVHLVGNLGAIGLRCGELTT